MQMAKVECLRIKIYSLRALFEQPHCQSEQVVKVNSIAQRQQPLVMLQHGCQAWELVQALILALDGVYHLLNLQHMQAPVRK